MKFTVFAIFIAFVCCNSADSALADKITPKDYSLKNDEALAFCKKNGMNEDFYFLIDLSVHSGKNRFFIYDFKQKKIIDQNLVTHGTCDIPTEHEDMWEKARFSNTNDSHCSAYGKYKIGARDQSAWGIKIKYWLKGLEKSNDNAEKRVIVLHSWEAVANKEVYPEFSPLSWGCPAVSDAFMEKLDVRLKKVKKPVLLWIVD